MFTIALRQQCENNNDYLEIILESFEILIKT
jgi:hypothetical protein